jgi:3-dehydroquinate dehydratase-2
MPDFLVIHGPNLNLLGNREPETYGSATLQEIDTMIAGAAAELGCSVRCQQSNQEGEIVDAIQQAQSWAAGILINPAGYSHTSVAIHDALVASRIPCIEVHLSNIHAREEFRQHSLTARACRGVLAGFGPRGYIAGLRLLLDLVSAGA